MSAAGYCAGGPPPSRILAAEMQCEVPSASAVLLTVAGQARSTAPGDAGKPRRPRTKPRQASKLALRRYHAPQSPPRLTGRPWRRLWTVGKGIARTESGSAPSEAYTPCRSKDYLRSAWGASALVSDAHPPAHSDLGTARRSVIFPAFAFTLLHFPCPPHLFTAEYRDPEQL